MMGIVKVNAPEHLRLCDHYARSIGFKQPVCLRYAGGAFDDEFNRSRVASVRYAIPRLNELTGLVLQSHDSVSGFDRTQHRAGLRNTRSVRGRWSQTG